MMLKLARVCTIIWAGLDLFPTTIWVTPSSDLIGTGFMVR
jgi:hypothetical protein